MTDIYSHLSDVQKKLNVPKTRVNKFAGYNYRNTEDIVEAAKKVMPPGCCLTMDDDIIMIGDRYYVKSTASFSFEGHTVSMKGYAREPLEKKGSDMSQITGGCSTYARRYALAGLLAIDDGEDCDNHDNTEHYKPQQQKKSEPPKRASPLKNTKDLYDLVIKQKTNNDLLYAKELLNSLTREEKVALSKMFNAEELEWVKMVSAAKVPQ